MDLEAEIRDIRRRAGLTEMIPNENPEEAYRAGYDLGFADQQYRRDWQNPYVNMNARWAMVRGYEAAWNDKRKQNP